MFLPTLLVHTVRGLARTPFFTVTAVLSLAIGIGANATIFTAANALLFAPTRGVAAPDRLVNIGRTTRGEGFDTVSYPTYRDVRDRTDVFSGVYASRLEPEAMSLGSADGAERVYAEFVSASYFDVIGARPHAGAFFRTDEEAPGTPLRRVVFGHAFWARRFAADPTVVGREVMLNGDPFVVAGIAPEGFRGTTILAPDIWVPLTAHAQSTPTRALLDGRQNHWLVLGARLAPGVSIDQARQVAGAVAARLESEYPEIHGQRGLAVQPASRVPGEAGQAATAFLGVLMALVGLVQLVACTNLAGLMLARVTGRAREIAVRLSLGASRRSVVTLLLAESLALFTIGAVLALAVSVWTSAALASVLTTLPIPVFVDLAVDWRVVAFTAGLAMATGVLTGLVPAWQATRASLSADLKADAMAPRRRRLRHAFVAAQIAACFVLVVMAGLFFQALSRAADLDTGMTIDGVDVASVNLDLSGQPEDRWAAVALDLRAAFGAVPGVASVGVARMVPLQLGSMGLGGLRRPGEVGTPDAPAEIAADWNVITPGFLSTVGIPIVQGRDLTDADRQGAPRVAIVSQRFAERVWPGADPVGQVLEHGEFSPGRESSIARLTVIGVARDAKSRSIGETPRAFIYVPLAQHPTPQVSFFLRRDPSVPATTSLAPAIRETLRQYDRNLPLVSLASFRQMADVGLLPQRIAATVAGLLGGVALVLAAIGIYGVTAFAVASRTREIGVRVALGADPSTIRRLVLLQGLRLTTIGGGIGLMVAMGASQLVRSLLFGVSPVDPVAFGATAAGLAGIALVAGLAPARRASRVDPVVALRAD